MSCRCGSTPLTMPTLRQVRSGFGLRCLARRLRTPMQWVRGWIEASARAPSTNRNRAQVRNPNLVKRPGPTFDHGAAVPSNHLGVGSWSW